MTWQNRLRFAIARSGKTIDAVASEAGVAEVALRRMLEGGSEPPIDDLVRLAAAVDVTVASLLGEAPPDVVHLREITDAEIPQEFASRGATIVYEVSGDALAEAGIVNGDLLFVAPVADITKASARFVVCRRTHEDVLLAHDGSAKEDVIGVVVGRSGAIS